MLKRLKLHLYRRKTKKLRKGLKNSLIESEKIRTSDIETIQTTWKKLQIAKISKYDKFYNFSLYYAFVTQDISILWGNYNLTDSKAERNLYGRLLSMTIIEFLDDINGLLGKDLRQELESNGMSEYAITLNQINKTYARLKTKKNSELRQIRNNVAAHKTKIAKDLINLSNEDYYTDLDDVTSIVIETNIILNKLTSEIINSIIKQILSERSL